MFGLFKPKDSQSNKLMSLPHGSCLQIHQIAAAGCGDMIWSKKMFCIFADFLRNEERVKGEEEKKFSELKNAND